PSAPLQRMKSGYQSAVYAASTFVAFISSLAIRRMLAAESEQKGSLRVSVCDRCMRMSCMRVCSQRDERAFQEILGGLSLAERTQQVHAAEVAINTQLSDIA